MKNLIKNSIRFALFILIQVFVLDKIRLNQMVTPYLYFLFILWLPFNINKNIHMIIAFALGFCVDSFRHTPGFHAAACVLIAYLRPFLINLLITHDEIEGNYQEPDLKSFGGFMQYGTYFFTLSLIHNAWLFLLEAWQFGNIWYFFIKTIFATLISIVLIFICELLFVRNKNFKANAI